MVLLDVLEEEVTTPEPSSSETTDPNVAKPGDRHWKGDFVAWRAILSLRSKVEPSVHGVDALGKTTATTFRGGGYQRCGTRSSLSES